MTTRDSRIETLIGTLDRALGARLTPGTDAWPVARRIFDTLRKPAGAMRNPGIRPLPAPAILSAALAPTRNDRSDLSPIAAIVEALAPDLDWWSRMGAAGDPATFTDAHAFIVGPGGLEDRDDAEIGVSVLAPNVRYPDHHHPPPEVYLAMTPGIWRKGDGSWVEPGIGGTVFNAPNDVHAMKSHATPLFAFWCLPLK